MTLFKKCRLNPYAGLIIFIVVISFMYSQTISRKIFNNYNKKTNFNLLYIILIHLLYMYNLKIIGSSTFLLLDLWKIWD